MRLVVQLCLYLFLDVLLVLWPFGSTQTQFLKVMEAAMEKVKKYLFHHMDVAKQSRVLDPTQLGSLSHDIALYPHVLPTYLCT